MSWHNWQPCACGKRGYIAKAGAKTARRILGGDHLSVYRCAVSGNWHLGHKPAKLTRGEITRDEVHGPDKPSIQDRAS